MYTFVDENKKGLDKETLDILFRELNKELRKKLKKCDKSFKVELYVVGGACVVTTLGTRTTTVDVDAVWSAGAEMRDCINEVGDRYGIGHGWCNCDFKRTKSYTDKIAYNSNVYASYDRLVVRMVNLDLLLAMKLIAFREHKPTDREDCIAIINILRSKGVSVTSDTVKQTVIKYYKSLDVLSKDARDFIGG